MLTEIRLEAMVRNFDWSSAAAQYEALYKGLIGHRPVPVVTAPARRRPRPATAELPVAA